MNADEGDDALQARRERLAQALRAAKPPPRDATSQPSPAGAKGAAWSMLARAGSDLGAGVGLGWAVGWGVDFVLHTKPLFTIVFFLVGFVAGVWGVVRAASPKSGK